MGVFDFLIVVFGKKLNAIVIDYVRVGNLQEMCQGLTIVKSSLNLDRCWRIASDLVGAGSEAMLLGSGR